jgi:hypothetical protein
VEREVRMTDTMWRAEVLQYNGTHWAANALVFDTEAEALSYGFALRARWTMADKIRAVRDTTPHRETYVPGSEANHYQDIRG